MKNYLKKGFEFEVLMELCKSINYKKIFFRQYSCAFSFFSDFSSYQNPYCGIINCV